MNQKLDVEYMLETSTTYVSIQYFQDMSGEGGGIHTGQLAHLRENQEPTGNLLWIYRKW